MSINGGFGDLPAEDRAEAMEQACELGDVAYFFDMPPEDRGRVYDSAAGWSEWEGGNG